MLKSNFKKSERGYTVSVSGSMTIQYLPELLKPLIKLIDEPGDIVLDLHDVTDVDISGLQLLCSIDKSLTEQGKELIIDKKYPKILTKTIEDAGYEISPLIKLLDKGGS
jgi:anti-anti-sigma regulatory factor